MLNTSLVRNELNRNDVEIIKVPANEIAEDLGSSRVANMVILGAWVKRSGVVLLDSLIQSLAEVLSKDKIDLLSLNERALRKGEELA